MGAYTIRRIVGVAINLFLVSIFVFLALRLVPGDVTGGILGDNANQAQRDAFKKQHGLDGSAFDQYIHWAGGAVTGDLGKSLRSNLPVESEFKTRLPVTLEIVILSFLFTSLFGIAGGVIAATKQDTAFDYAVRASSVFGISIPSFLLLTIMLIVPARLWHYAPPFGAVHFFNDPLHNLQLFLPPTLLLAIGGSAVLMRLTRTALLDVLRQDYLRTARSKGLTETNVIFKHAFRNALPPVLTFMGLQLGFLFAGSIIMEQVMGLPGLGTWALTAIQSKDYPIIMAFSLYTAAMLMIISLAVDLLYGYLDPRIHYS